MDLVKTGKFIAKLRLEKNYTQEELGERIGVTNKTISRWENGNYLPSVDMLQLLGKEFSVSINELLCGERISEEEYRENAEKTLVSVLKQSPFTLKDKCTFFKKKWLKEHRMTMVMSALVYLGILLFFILQGWYIACAACVPLWLVLYLVLYNRMMVYVEQNAYDGSGQ